MKQQNKKPSTSLRKTLTRKGKSLQGKQGKFIVEFGKNGDISIHSDNNEGLKRFIDLMTMLATQLLWKLHLEGKEKRKR